MSFRVLVADDDDLTRTLIILALGAVGVKDTAAATNGQEVMTLIRQQPFDLLMLDWYMPGKTGLEVVEAIRSQGSQVPIVMVSAESGRDQIVAAMRAGASDYLLKPFDAKTLWSKLEKYRNADSTISAGKAAAIPAAPV